jgi:hypothetical protein
MAALSPEQRGRVRVAVSKGEAVGDPAIAPAVIDLAERVERAQARHWLLRLNGAVVAAVSAINAVIQFRLHHTALGLLWLLVTCFWLSYIYWVPRLSARSVSRAGRAKEAARALIGGGA